MAFDDALFQLGMDLTRSSTAQKEDLVVSKFAPRAKEDRQSALVERSGVRYAGKHLIIDLIGAERLDDLKFVEDTLIQCVAAAGARLVHMHVHSLSPKRGVSGVAVLEDSHISLHTWPDSGYAAFDVFTGGQTDPHVCVEILREAFNARDVRVKEHQRGEGLAAVAAVQGSKAPVRLRAVRKARAA